METKLGKTVVIAHNSSENSADIFSAYKKRHTYVGDICERRLSAS